MNTSNQMSGINGASIGGALQERKVYKVGDTIMARHNHYTQIIPDNHNFDYGNNGEQILELEVKSIKTIKLITE